MDYTEELTKEELQKISINFRRVSSDFLNCNQSSYHRLLKKLLHYIENTPVIKSFIDTRNLKSFDFTCLKENSDSLRFELPVDDSEEIAYIYKLLTFISDNIFDIFNLTFRYGSHKRGTTHKVQTFNNEIVRPLINHISTYLTEIKIDSGFQDNYNVTNQFTFKQDFRGQINSASGNSTITAHQAYKEADIEEIKDYSKDFLSALTESQEINKEDKLSLVELLEATIQNLEKEAPKKTILRIAMEKIKNVTDTVDTGTTLFLLGAKLIELLNNL